MTLQSRTPLPLLLTLLLWGPPAGAADSNFNLDPERVHPFEQHDAPVRVETVTLPPWPRDADLIAFVPDGPTRPFRFYIDGKNLSTDARGEEVRYTLVIESTTGTRNASVEGMRCNLRGAYKTFAYGSAGRFTRAPETDWQPIADEGSESYRDDLRRNRFCIARETKARSVKDMLRALRGRGSATDAIGFQSQ